MNTSAVDVSAAENGNHFLPNQLKSKLRVREQELADRIDRWDLEFALEKMVWDKQITAEQCASAEQEFKRFVFLIGLDVKPIAMISPRLDDVWHQMVLFTRRYEQFCKDTVGFFIHHTPETPDSPIPVEAAVNFINEYERFFGEIPEIWFSGMTAKLRSYYQARPFAVKPPVRWSGWTGEDKRPLVDPYHF